MTITTKEDILILVKETKEGNQEAFRELEGVAKPLLISLSNKFAAFHDKFEFEDFYSIGLHSLHKACMSFKDGNPSFLNYAKVIILRSFWREVDYWNQGKRNIFQNSEVSFETEEISYANNLDEIAFMGEFRDNLNAIIDECFEKKRGKIVKMYLFSDAKISDIAEETGINTKNVYKIIERGMHRLKEEYVKRYNP
jgi:RNA polymerase sigma factor (sigma-70 family)